MPHCHATRKQPFHRGDAVALRGESERTKSVEHVGTPKTLLTSRSASLTKGKLKVAQESVRSGSTSIVGLLPQQCPIEDKYLLSDELGSGGYSTVWLATCKATGTRCAVKCIQLHREKEYQRTINEFRIQSRLDHPNLLKVFACIQDEKNSKMYLACESCDRDLYNELSIARLYNTGVSTKGLPQYLVANLCVQMLRGVSYMHEQRIAHRDLKPQNMMIAQRYGSPTLKLIDFGFAKEYKDEGKMFSRVGTLMYTAPEVLRATPRCGYSQSCDVWSLGITLFALCVNDTPFTGALDLRKEDTVRQKILANEVVYHSFLWSDVHPTFKEMTQALLTHCPESRPDVSSVLAMHEDWLMATRKQSSAQACCTIS